MKSTAAEKKVDYRLLGLLSNLVICASCLREGRITPVPQIFSHRHRPKALCSGCTRPSGSDVRRNITRLASRK